MADERQAADRPRRLRHRHQHLDALLLLLQDRWQVRVVCDKDESRARAPAARAPGAEVAGSLEAVLARDEVDVVDICLPPALHVPAVRAALRSGKDVVCEKPLAGSIAEVEGIAALAAATGRVVCPVQQYRFGKGPRKLWRLIEAGVPGRSLVATVETPWDRGPAYDRVPWRGRKESELGGALVSHAIHAHDLLTEVLGPVGRVQAAIATRVDCIETEDRAAACLAMADGSLATLAVTLASAAEITRLRFCFANLVVESALYPFRPASDPWRFVPRDPDTAAEVETLLQDFRPGPEGFEGLFAELAVSLETGEEPPVTLVDARRSIELATTLDYAAATREAVELPLRPSHPACGRWFRWLPAQVVVRPTVAAEIAAETGWAHSGRSSVRTWWIGAAALVVSARALAATELRFMCYLDGNECDVAKTLLDDSHKADPDIEVTVDPAAPGTILGVEIAGREPVRALSLATENYTQLFERFDFLRCLWNSVFITATATLIMLLINSIAAFALAKYDFRGRDLVFVSTIATLSIPPTVVLVPVFLVVSKLGLLNTPWGVVWPGVATPTGVFLLRQYMLTIPDELIDAARMDNASEWKIYRRIVLPLAAPALAVLAIFAVMWRWNDSLLPLVVLSRSEQFTLELAPNSFKGEMHTQWGNLLAMTVLTLLPITLVFGFLQRYVPTGIATTGIK